MTDAAAVDAAPDDADIFANSASFVNVFKASVIF